MKKTCPVCDAIIIGRSDKVFCSSECRSQFHNEKNRPERSIIKRINRQLMSNRLILKQLPAHKIKKINHNDLLKLGFDFDYLTNVYRTQKGKLYFFCYDYGYLQLTNNSYTVVKRMDYI